MLGLGLAAFALLATSDGQAQMSVPEPSPSGEATRAFSSSLEIQSLSLGDAFQSTLPTATASPVTTGRVGEEVSEVSPVGLPVSSVRQAITLFGSDEISCGPRVFCAVSEEDFAGTLEWQLGQKDSSLPPLVGWCSDVARSTLRNALVVKVISSTSIADALDCPDCRFRDSCKLRSQMSFEQSQTCLLGSISTLEALISSPERVKNLTAPPVSILEVDRISGLPLTLEQKEKIIADTLLPFRSANELLRVTEAQSEGCGCFENE